jgi:HTH-type transcriptional regulator, competence development regulator
MVIGTNIGSYIQNLRKERKMSLKEVADHVGIDISMLSKIEHGERQLQSHMIAPIADLFEIDYKSIQIQFLNQRIMQEFGNEPYLLESLVVYVNSK